MEPYPESQTGAAGAPLDPVQPFGPARSRGIFCNRTLNLNAIRAIGYDMDYTLIDYKMNVWEKSAYASIRERLIGQGWPVEELSFDHELVMRGLVIDTDHGNIVKANRFGYVKRAFHGTRPLQFDSQRRLYQRALVDLSEPRWRFINTLFSISEACIYLQLVDLLDSGRLAPSIGYSDLYRHVRRVLDEAHMEGKLKGEVIADPDRFVELDPEMPLSLLDQKRAGKKLLLISNSEWPYASPMLSAVFDHHLPGSMTWRELFDITILSARKPEFFTLKMPAFELVSDDGLLREHHGLFRTGGIYIGGNASLVEQSFRLRGDEILYVGDHIFADVNVTKNILRWRTALILRELEEEITALDEFESKQKELSQLMELKEGMELRYANLRLDLLRSQHKYGPISARSQASIEKEMTTLHTELFKLDGLIAPIATAAGSLLNPNWGLLMRTGADKSHFARQVERYADVYTGRVSNFLHLTPFAFLRSRRGSLPHDDPCPSAPAAPIL